MRFCGVMLGCLAVPKLLLLAGTYDVGKAVVWACDCTLDSSRLVASSGDQKILIFDVCSGALLNEIAEQGPCK